MKYKVSSPTRTYDIDVTESGALFHVRLIDGVRTEEFDIDFKSTGGGSLYSMLVGSESFRAIIQKSQGVHSVFTRGHRFEFTVEDERTHLMRSLIDNRKSGTGGEMKAPIPGLVTKILVAEGDEVQQGQGVLILEAMKMENEIKSPAAGKICRLAVQSGKNVEKGQVLFAVSFDQPGDTFDNDR